MADTKDPIPPREVASPTDPLCSSCNLPIASHATAVSHYGPRGVTIEHQACWQSRTFGGGTK